MMEQWNTTRQVQLAGQLLILYKDIASIVKRCPFLPGKVAARTVPRGIRDIRRWRICSKDPLR